MIGHRQAVVPALDDGRTSRTPGGRCRPATARSPPDAPSTGSGLGSQRHSGGLADDLAQERVLDVAHGAAVHQQGDRDAGVRDDPQATRPARGWSRRGRRPGPGRRPGRGSSRRPSGCPGCRGPARRPAARASPRRWARRATPSRRGRGPGRGRPGRSATVSSAVALISPAGPDERGMPHCGVSRSAPGSPTCPHAARNRSTSSGSVMVCSSPSGLEELLAQHLVPDLAA